MSNEKKYPTDEIHIKEEFSPYVKYEDIPGGHRTCIKIPNKYDVQLSVFNMIPGITLIKEDSKLSDYYQSSNELLYYEHPEETIIINFLTKGQCQLKVGPDKYMFRKENDINIFIKELNPESFSYIGEITLFHILINNKQFKKYFPKQYSLYYEVVKNLFDEARKEKNIIFKSPDMLTNIIKDVQHIKMEREITNKLYYQLKTLEFLLLLNDYGIRDETIEQRTYSDVTIRVVRNIKNSLSRNIASYVSLEQISASYGINLTTLKNCFKDMYGKPLYTWYKEYKFYRAKELIKNTDYPISKIANMIGYKSSSKFAKAFKKEMGVLPSSYRKNKK